DNKIAADLRSRLIAPCAPGNNLCKFQQDADDADVFTKIILGPGGKTHKIRLRVMSSAVSHDDNDNRKIWATDQKRQSARIFSQFKRSLQNDGVVLYVGHSRLGTGPGFKPLDVAGWAEAEKNKPVLNEMVETLQNANKTPQILGMLSCEGENYYGHALHKAAPKSSLLLTRQTMSSKDAYKLSEAVLNSLLSRNCKSDFDNKVQEQVVDIWRVPFSKPKPVQEILPHLYGFFEPITRTFAAPKTIPWFEFPLDTNPGSIRVPGPASTRQ
ncbi:MAG: hypothetical protein H7235_06270, partial [Bdellovibrionaceae bacterium]|nr:hypothetical protein [Pseudobdellovibrionaceae bacterium]